MLGFGGLEGKFTQEKCRGPDWVQNADMHFARTCTVEMHVQMTLYGKLMEKCRGPDWAQNADTHTHFARACAIEMHAHMSQETSEESLCTDVYRKNAAAQIGPRTRTHTLCEPVQSKCASTCHRSHQKSHFLKKNAGIMPRPRLGPEHGHTLCARLRSRNACPNVTRDIRRATLYGPRMRTHTLCEPAQSKRMSRLHKSHLIQKFTGKLPRPRVSTLIKHRPLLLP